MSDQEVPAQPGNGAIPDDKQPVSPGARLAASRQERGWTIEQVASQLNLAPRQVVAIENDDYAALPGMPIVRGFIRAYAKLLKVDAVPLLATLGGQTVFTNQVAPGKNLATPFSEKRLPSMTDRPGLSSKWIVGLLLVLLTGVALWASGLVNFSNMSSQVKDGAESMPGTAERSETNSAPGDATPLAQPVPADQAINPGSSDAGSAGQTMQSAAASAGATQVAPLEPVSAKGLTLNVREESWIEIRRASDNKLVFSRLVKAGEVQSFEINEPVSLVIGNAAGVDATLRGEPIVLKSGKSNVARLSVK